MLLMGVDSRRIYVITSAIGGALAGLASCLLVLQYDVQPFVGLTFGPITFLICVLGGLGNMVGGVCRGFPLRRDHLGILPRPRMGAMFLPWVFCRADVLPPAGPFGTPLVKTWVSWIVAAAMLIALPCVFHDPYPLHILVLVLIWSFLYTSWSMMGRFGLVSLGHGGFVGIGAYVTALLWNYLHISRWIGIPLTMLAAAVAPVLIGYPCFRFRITGHYFALLTLALGAIVLQVITATRDLTGGSLGYTPERFNGGSSIYAVQFLGKATWYLIALGIWSVALLIRYRVERSMLRYALEAIAEDENAAAAAGGHVTVEKLKITVLSAVMTAFCRRALLPVPDVHLARQVSARKGGRRNPRVAVCKLASLSHGAR